MRIAVLVECTGNFRNFLVFHKLGSAKVTDTPVIFTNKIITIIFILLVQVPAINKIKQRLVLTCSAASHLDDALALSRDLAIVEGSNSNCDLNG
jgi:hypothetical protein